MVNLAFEKSFDGLVENYLVVHLKLVPWRDRVRTLRRLRFFSSLDDPTRFHLAQVFVSRLLQHRLCESRAVRHLNMLLGQDTVHGVLDFVLQSLLGRGFVVRHLQHARLMLLSCATSILNLEHVGLRDSLTLDQPAGRRLSHAFIH